MANKAISDLPTTTTPASTDMFESNQGGTSKSQTRAQLHTLESGESFTGEDANAPSIVDEAASATNPTLIPDKSDLDSGLGHAAADALSLVAGGVEAVRYTESTGVLQDHQTTAGITADTTQTQGQGPLTASFNEVSTVANDDDTVTLPTAATGRLVSIVNNGANRLRVFPASSDDLGNGADTQTHMPTGTRGVWFAYDATNWATVVNPRTGQVDEILRASGDLSLNNTSWTDFPTISTLSLLADPGDWVDVGFSGVANSAALTLLMDVKSGGGAPEVWSLGGTEVAAASGVAAWRYQLSITQPGGGVVTKQIVAGDLSTGVLTLTLRFKTSSAVAKTMFASANLPMHWWARNNGP